VNASSFDPHRASISSHFRQVGVVSIYLAMLCTAPPLEDGGSATDPPAGVSNGTLACWASAAGTLRRPAWDHYRVGGFGGVATDVLLVWALRAGMLLLAPLNPYLLRLGLAACALAAVFVVAKLVALLSACSAAWHAALLSRSARSADVGLTKARCRPRARA
jgi:hypothetical protein